jgi:hypothetical protein
MAMYGRNTAAKHLRQQLKNTEQYTVTNRASCWKLHGISDRCSKYQIADQADECPKHDGGLDEEKYNFMVTVRQETMTYRPAVFRHQRLCQDKSTKSSLCMA